MAQKTPWLPLNNPLLVELVTRPAANKREEGLAKVMKGNFAIFDESLPLELMLINRCNLEAIFLPSQFDIVWATGKNSLLGKVLKF